MPDPEQTEVNRTDPPLPLWQREGGKGLGLGYVLEAERVGVVDGSDLRGAQEASRRHLGFGPE